MIIIIIIVCRSIYYFSLAKLWNGKFSRSGWYSVRIVVDEIIIFKTISPETNS